VQTVTEIVYGLAVGSGIAAAFAIADAVKRSAQALERIATELAQIDVEELLRDRRA
jgi:hypothetical protein